MSRQIYFDDQLRAGLIDWLVQISEEIVLSDETIFIAVAYIDQFLCCMRVMKHILPLLGLTALWMAS